MAILRRFTPLFGMAALALLPNTLPLQAQSNWTTDFSEFDGNQYFEAGNDGYWNEEEQTYVLTEAAGDRGGRVYNRTAFSMAVFTARFDVRIGGGDGADGMVFGWVPVFDYGENRGGSHDFTNTGGFAVEFDCYNNGDWDDNSGQHIAILQNNYDNTLAQHNFDEGVIEDNAWHSVEVVNNLGAMEVYWEGELVIEYQIENYEPFEGYFGFSGATGGLSNWHIVDNVEIVIGGPVIAVEPDSIMFGASDAESIQASLWIYNLAEEQDQWHILNYDVTDEGGGPDWLDVDARVAEGAVAPGDSIEVGLTATIGNLDDGEYERSIVVSSNDSDRPLVEIPAAVLVVSGYGRVFGTVTAAADGQPLAGASVEAWPRVGFHVEPVETAADGAYEFAFPLDFAVEIRALKNEYLSQWADGDITPTAEQPEVEVNFALLHGELELSPAVMEAELFHDEEIQRTINLRNDGDGPLTWRAAFVFPGGVAEPWENLLTLALAETLNTTRSEGVAFAAGRFFVAGRDSALNRVIFVLDPAGNRIGSFPQMGTSLIGMLDLAWDGELLWGSGERRIFGFTTGGDSITSIPTPENRTGRGLAWDTDRRLLWMCDRGSNLFGLDRDGAVQATLEAENLSKFGLGYLPEDPDGFNLYIYHDAGDSSRISKMNTADGQVMPVRNLGPHGPGTGAGMDVTGEYDPRSWVMADVRNIIPQQGGDKLELWQLAANTTWISADPLEGVVEADAQGEVNVTLRSPGMRDMSFAAGLRFEHDGFGEADTVAISLTISPDDPPPPENQPPGEFSLLEPENLANLLVDLQQEPDAEVNLRLFSWSRSLDPDSTDQVTYRLWFKDFSPIDSAETGFSCDFAVADTQLVVSVSALIVDSLSGFSTIYTYLAWWVEAISGDDTVRSRELYQATVEVPDSSPRGLAPLEFSLSAAYPNPFNSRLSIAYGLDRSGPASLKIYDVAGRLIAAPLSGERRAGNYRYTWDAATLAAGVYIIRLESAGRVRNGKAVLVK